jgi:hypothetical protein
MGIKIKSEIIVKGEVVEKNGISIFVYYSTDNLIESIKVDEEVEIVDIEKEEISRGHIMSVSHLEILEINNGIVYKVMVKLDKEWEKDHKEVKIVSTMANSLFDLLISEIRDSML